MLFSNHAGDNLPPPPDVVPARWVQQVREQVLAERREALGELEIGLWHAQEVSGETWPKSLHLLGYGDHETDVLTRDKVVSGKKCIQVVINERTTDAVSLAETVAAYDFLIPESLTGVSCKLTHNEKPRDVQQWNAATTCGPIILRANVPQIVQGADYQAPRLPDTPVKGLAVNAITIFEEMATMLTLATWLHQLSPASYEEFKSHGI